jgi:hypothetical protein
MLLIRATGSGSENGYVRKTWTDSLIVAGWAEVCGDRSKGMSAKANTRAAFGLNDGIGFMWSLSDCGVRPKVSQTYENHNLKKQ